MRELAPIILFVYKRPEHTLKVLQALKANEFAEVSTLYIYSEGPKAGDQAKVNEVRRIIRSEKWCKEVIIKESPINKGCADSIIDGITEVLNKHDKVIILEDDILTAKGFLNYMNFALEYYNDFDNVYGIAGFTIKNNLIGQDAFFLPLPNSWGWATYKRAWDSFELNGSKLLYEIEPVKDDFDFGGFPYYQMLKDQVQNKIDAWDIRFYGSMFLNDGLFLWPDRSLTKNIGFDNSGTHTLNAEFGDNKIIETFVNPAGVKPELNRRVVEKYKKQYSKLIQKPSLLQRVINRL